MVAEILAQARNGDTVMLCLHVYERLSASSPCKVALVSEVLREWKYLGIQGPFDPPKKFTRVTQGGERDEAGGSYRFAVACGSCVNAETRGRKDIDLVETFWSDGRLVVADFTIPNEGVRN